MLRVDGEALGKGIRDGGGDLCAPGVACGGFAEETEKGLREGPPGIGKGFRAEGSECGFVASEEEWG